MLAEGIFSLGSENMERKGRNGRQKGGKREEGRKKRRGKKVYKDGDTGQLEVGTKAGHCNLDGPNSDLPSYLR